MEKAKRDMISMIIIMGISFLFCVWFIPAEIRVTDHGTSAFTSRTFPYLLMSAMLVISFIGFCKAFWSFRRIQKSEAEMQKKRQEAEDTQVQPGKGSRLPYTAFILILAYGMLFQYLGYMLSALIFVTAFLWMLGCRKYTYYLGCCMFCGAIWLIFTQILRVPLP